MEEKRRPTLAELKEMPVDLLRFEAAQIGVEALFLDLFEIDRAAWALQTDPEITPERVIELRERLRLASESVETESEVVL